MPDKVKGVGIDPVREKLIELIHHCTSCEECHDADIADHLIANGVTIQPLTNCQQWIPVTERLPQEFVSVLVCIPSETPLPTVKEAYLANGCWATKMWIFKQEEITHWMPLPEPPKGE